MTSLILYSKNKVKWNIVKLFIRIKSIITFLKLSSRILKNKPTGNWLEK